MMFDKKEHAKKLLNVSGIVVHASMLSEGMSIANNGMTDIAFANMATGAFGVLGVALDKAYGDISEAETDFVYENGLRYPLDDKGGVSNG